MGRHPYCPGRDLPKAEQPKSDYGDGPAWHVASSLYAKTEGTIKSTAVVCKTEKGIWLQEEGYEEQKETKGSVTTGRWVRVPRHWQFYARTEKRLPYNGLKPE